MSLFRVASILVICGLAFSAVGQSATPQNPATAPSAKPDDTPKSITESVSGTLQFAEGNFLGLAEAMPEDKYSYVPTVGNFDWRAQLRRTSEARRLCSVRLLQRI